MKNSLFSPPGFLSKLGMILFGIVITFLILELSLNIASKFVSRKTSPASAGKSAKSYTILCVGDSFTYGVGASQGYSYPEQLGGLLNKNFPEREFEVLNLGLPGSNSSQALKALPGQIKDYLPELVIIWVGANNCWNFTDTNYFLFADRMNIRIFLRKTDSHLYNKSRAYKLLKHIFINLRKRIEDNPPKDLIEVDHTAAEKQQRALAEAQALIEEDKTNRKPILEKLKNAYELNKDLEFIVGLLKKYYPVKDFSSMLIAFFESVGDKDRLREIRRTGVYNENSSRDFNLGYKDSHKQAYDRLLQYDLEKMINAAKENNIEVILLTYNSDDIERGGDNVIIRRLADRNGISCVDTAAIFRNLLQDHKFEDFFVSDGHHNNAGYKVIAEAIYKILNLDLRLSGD